jgi:TPP-dependent pyruvate/acetoin dehydrogenase alpha subunit
VHYSRAADVVSKNPEALVHGVPSIAVDAHDPVAIYRVAYEAIVRARQRRGATLLECMTDIQTVLDNADSSPADGGSNDPLAVMKKYLKSKGIEPELHNGQIVAAFNYELDLATRFLDR